MRTSIAVAAASAVAIAAGAGVAGAQMNVITPASINGTTTGKAPAAYRRAFGGGRTDRLEGNITRLVFNGKQTEVYLGPNGRGSAIVTGNRGMRTASGVGPCSTEAEMRAAFPQARRVPGLGGLGWKVGRLWFRVEGGSVTSVMLVSSPAPAMARAFLGNTGSTCR